MAKKDSGNPFGIGVNTSSIARKKHMKNAGKSAEAYGRKAAVKVKNKKQEYDSAYNSKSKNAGTMGGHVAAEKYADKVTKGYKG